MSLTPTRRQTFANVAASQTDSVLVAAFANQKIRVVGLVFVNGDTGSTVTFNSKGGGAGTAISATFKTAANGGVSAQCDQGLFVTKSGEALTVTTGAGATTPVAIQVVYDILF